MDRSFSKQDRPFILRVSSTYRATIATATGTIPVDPSDDAGDGGGTSQGVSPEARTTDPNGHTPVSLRLTAVHRACHLPSKENHRGRRWICGQLAAASSRTSPPHNNYGLSLQNPMVDPKRTLSAVESIAVRKRTSVFALRPSDPRPRGGDCRPGTCGRFALQRAVSCPWKSR